MSANLQAPIAKIMAVLDPTRLLQPALEKAEWIAERSEAELLLYCCCYDSDLAFDHGAKIAKVERTRSWLERLAAGTRGRGTKASIEVAWDPEWRDAVARAAAASGVELVVKAANRHTPLARHRMQSADWDLLKGTGCPTLLVSHTAPPGRNIVLAAVRPGRARSGAPLDEHVVAVARRIAGAVDGELHAVTAYEGAAPFEAQAFAAACGLAPDRVHAVQGSAPKAVAGAVSRLAAGVVVIGCPPDERAAASIIGAAAERIIDAVPSDVVVVPS